MTMQVHEPSIANFMKGFARYEPTIMDSTAIMTYKTCPLKYFYRIVLGFTPKESAPYFGFGTAYHKFREVLQRLCDVEKQSVQEGFLLALESALNYYKKQPQPEINSKWEFLTLDRLEQSCTVAFKHWLKERIEGNIKVVAFEQPFILQLTDKEKIAGRADNIVEWRREPWGRDFKTTSKEGPYYSRTLEPNFQFTTYTWGEGKLTGHEVKGQIVEVLYNSKKQGPSINTYTTTRTRGQLARWEKDTLFWLAMIEKSRVEDHYPMNEKHCTFCEYHGVCKAPSESGQMSQLKSYYKVSPWDCTVTEEDE